MQPRLGSLLEEEPGFVFRLIPFIVAEVDVFLDLTFQFLVCAELVEIVLNKV